MQGIFKSKLAAPLVRVLLARVPEAASAPWCDTQLTETGAQASLLQQKQLVILTTSYLEEKKQAGFQLPELPDFFFWFLN